MAAFCLDGVKIGRSSGGAWPSAGRRIFAATNKPDEVKLCGVDRFVGGPSIGLVLHRIDQGGPR